jgi:four helix bundle protein
LIAAMTENELKRRTKDFALHVLQLVDSLSETRSGRILANQLGRSGTSVAANYRAACRSRSTAEMASKLAVVEEEADESGFWLELASIGRRAN